MSEKERREREDRKVTCFSLKFLRLNHISPAGPYYATPDFEAPQRVVNYGSAW